MGYSWRLGWTSLLGNPALVRREAGNFFVSSRSWALGAHARSTYYISTIYEISYQKSAQGHKMPLKTLVCEYPCHHPPFSTGPSEGILNVYHCVKSMILIKKGYQGHKGERAVLREIKWMPGVYGCASEFSFLIQHPFSL